MADDMGYSDIGCYGGEIQTPNLDRYGIEKQFRDSKARQYIQVNPFYLWTDDKIRCQLLTCVIALTALRLLEAVVNSNNSENEPISGATILEEMSHFDSVWLLYPGKRTPVRVLETPTDLQSEVLKAFGWTVADGGVLQGLESWSKNNEVLYIF